MSCIKAEGLYDRVYYNIYDLASLAVKIATVGALYCGIRFLVEWQQYLHQVTR